MEDVRETEGQGVDLKAFVSRMEVRAKEQGALRDLPSYAAVRYYHLGQREAPAHYLVLVSETFGVSLRWLATGKGPRRDYVKRAEEEGSRGQLTEEDFRLMEIRRALMVTVPFSDDPEGIDVLGPVGADLWTDVANNVLFAYRRPEDYNERDVWCFLQDLAELWTLPARIMGWDPETAVDMMPDRERRAYFLAMYQATIAALPEGEPDINGIAERLRLLVEAVDEALPPPPLTPHPHQEED